MPLKFLVDKLEDVEEAQRPLYVNDEESGKFRLDVLGVVSKTKVDEFRDNNIRLLKERDDLKDKYSSVDLDEYLAMKTERQKLKDKKLIDEGKVEELINERVTDMKKTSDKAISTLTSERDSALAQLASVLVDNELQRTAIELGAVSEEAVGDLVRRGKEVFRLKDGKSVPMNGETIIYGADGVTPKSMKEWMQEVQEKASFLFKTPKGSGSGPSTGTGFSGTVSKKSELKTSKDKAAYISKHGQAAYLSLPA